MSNRNFEPQSWDYRLDVPARVISSDSETRYTFDLGTREFRLKLRWEIGRGECAKFMSVECLHELTSRGDRMEPPLTAEVKALVVNIFEHRFDEDEDFQRHIRARAARWDTEGY